MVAIFRPPNIVSLTFQHLIIRGRNDQFHLPRGRKYFAFIIGEYYSGFCHGRTE